MPVAPSAVAGRSPEESLIHAVCASQKVEETKVVMPLVDWSQVPTGLTVAGLVRACEWGIEWVYQATRKRRHQSSKWRNRGKALLRESAKLVATATILVVALTYVQSSAWTNPKQLEQRLTERQTEILAEAYLAYDQPQQLLDYVNAHADLLVSFGDSAVRDAAFIADHQYLVSLGLLADGEIFQGEEMVKIRRKPTKVRSLRYPSKITPLGIKVVQQKLNLPTPAAPAKTS